MQLEFDWARRKRCAQRTDASLSEIDVPLLQRAVIRMVLEHERAVVIDPERKIVRLAISYAEAITWIRENVDECSNLSADRSPVRRAVKTWCDREILLTLGGRPTTIAAHFGRLSDWHARQQARREALLQSWEIVTSRDLPGPDVTSCDLSMNERMNEDLHSFIHCEDPSALSAQVLSRLPVSVFEARVKGLALLAEIDRWWASAAEDDAGLNFDRQDAVAAILAARESAQGDPVRYVARCLARGVIFKYRRAAERFLAECAREAEQNALAEAARRPKPPRKNWLREWQQRPNVEENDDG